MAHNIPNASAIVVKKCSHPDNCLEKYFSNGYCRIHYNRLRRTGELGLVERTRVFNITDKTQKCIIEGCSKLQRKVGMCNMHYDRKYRTGDVGSPDTILFVDIAPEGYKTCQNKDCKVPLKLQTDFHRKFDKRDNKYKIVSYCKICTREEFVKCRYKLSKEEYRKLEEQTNCPLCYKKVKLVVDHCHKTGKVRGLLCDNCNRAIGLLGDNYHTLFNAWLYMKENSQ